MKQGKSLFTTIVLAIIVFSTASQGFFGQTISLIIGAVGLLLTGLWKQFYDTSKNQWLFESWKLPMIITNLAAFTITMLAIIKNYLETQTLDLSGATAFFVKAPIMLNAIILVVNEVFAKTPALAQSSEPVNKI